MKHAIVAGLGALSLVGAASAQFEPPMVDRGRKLSPVTALPAPGPYDNTTGIQLRAAPGATIHYTLDGSTPSEASPSLAPGQQLFVTGVYDGDRGLTTGYTIRAVATAPDRTTSDPAAFGYVVRRRDRTAYQSEIVASGVRMIRDSDNDKMFLVRGTKAWALIDTGMGRGALRDYIARYTGGLPLVVIFTHSHGDHIGQADQFIAGSVEYVGAPDRPATAAFLAQRGVPPDLIASRLRPLADGARVDLGDRALEIVSVPGHTPGSISILDPATGNLFTGDTFGNNSPLPPDVMWLQWYDQPIDVYLAHVRAARHLLDGRVTRIFTGHNDHPLEGTAFLDHLERAIQDGLDRGEAALVPSWRPQGGVQLIDGDRFAEPNWFAVNVNRRTFLPAPPDKIAGLSDLFVEGGAIEPRFSPDIHAYRIMRTSPGPLNLVVVPTSRRFRGLMANGKAIRSGVPTHIAGRTVVTVLSPDGSRTSDYTLTIE